VAVRLPIAVICGAVAGVLLALPVHLAGHNQTPQTPPRATFRATSNTIEVDLVVRDSRDLFVLGMTADDLELYEDGQKQQIQQCYLVRTDPATGLSSADGGEVKFDDLRSHRIFVLVFDERDLDTGSLLRVKAGAQAFLDQEFKSGDLGAVVVNGRIYQGKLTSSKAALQAAVRSVKPAFDSRESRLRSFREFPRIPGEAEAVRIAGGDRFLIQDLGEQACREDPATCTYEGGVQQVENKLQQKARSYLGQSRDATRYTLESLQLVTSALAPYPGRKTIVFLSDGFFIEESKSDLRLIAGMAARAGATIYTIDGRGLAGARPTPPDVTTRDRPTEGLLDRGEDGPTMLADGTGGLVVRHMDDVAKALGIVANDTSTYYVIGYQPVKAVMDGKFRKITVKAKNSSLTVRARKGYVASSLPPIK